MGDASIEGKKQDLIRMTEDPDFQAKVYQHAYKLTKKMMDAEDYKQDALVRFISAVQNKNSLQELEEIRPLPYVFAILNNIHVDKLRKMSGPMPREKTAHQTDQTQEGESEKLGRQKCELLAAQIGVSVEDIANHQQETGKLGSTGLGMEEQVVSRIIVEGFINSLPEELRKLAILLNEEYQLKELTGILKLSYGELKDRKRRVREALRDYKQQQFSERR